MIISSKFGLVWSFSLLLTRGSISHKAGVTISAGSLSHGHELGSESIWSVCERRAWNARRRYRVSLASSSPHSASLASHPLPPQLFSFQLQFGLRRHGDRLWGWSWLWVWAGRQKGQKNQQGFFFLCTNTHICCLKNEPLIICPQSQRWGLTYF